jgi:hypothetical protein
VVGCGGVKPVEPTDPSRARADGSDLFLGDTVGALCGGVHRACSSEDALWMEWKWRGIGDFLGYLGSV